MSRRKTTPKAKTHNPHVFSLRASRSASVLLTQVNFTPTLVHPENQPHNTVLPRKVSITPRFNEDRKHYTSCFINPLSYEQQSDMAMLVNHQNKIRESTSEILSSQILVPKPRRGSSCYCCVCRTHYEDYLEHIKSQQHRQKSREAPFTKYISELVKTIQPPPPGVLTRAAAKRMCPFGLPCQDPPKKKKVQEMNWGRGKGDETEGKREQSTVPKSELVE